MSIYPLKGTGPDGAIILMRAEDAPRRAGRGAEDERPPSPG